MSKREALAEKKARKRSNIDEQSEEEEEEEESKPEKEVGSDGEEFWRLNDKKRVSVSQFKGKTYVNLREFYEKDGEWLPTKKGITLDLQQWSTLKKLVKDIDQSFDSKSKSKKK